MQCMLSQVGLELQKHSNALEPVLVTISLNIFLFFHKERRHITSTSHSAKVSEKWLLISDSDNADTLISSFWSTDIDVI